MHKYKYKVAWLDKRGAKHETIVEATNPTIAERTVWEEEQECLSMMTTVQFH